MHFTSQFLHCCFLSWIKIGLCCGIEMTARDDGWVTCCCVGGVVQGIAKAIKSSHLHVQNSNWGGSRYKGQQRSKQHKHFFSQLKHSPHLHSNCAGTQPNIQHLQDCLQDTHCVHVHSKASVPWSGQHLKMQHLKDCSNVLFFRALKKWGFFHLGLFFSTLHKVGGCSISFHINCCCTILLDLDYE